MKVYLKEDFSYDGILFKTGVYELNKEKDKFNSIDNEFSVIDYALYENNITKFNLFRLESNDIFSIDIYENNMVFILNKGKSLNDTTIYYKPYNDITLSKYCTNKSTFYMFSINCLKDIKEFINVYDINESIIIKDFSKLKDSYIANNINTISANNFTLKEYETTFNGICTVLTKSSVYCEPNGNVEIVVGIKSSNNYSCVTTLDNISKVRSIDVLIELEKEFGDLSF